MRCGCDLLQVSRIAGILERREGALARLFSDLEVAEARRDGVALDSPVAQRRLAARWAAKEATVKALDRPDLGPRDIEVRTLPSGAPELWVLGQRTDLAVSLTHDGDVAMAFVVAPDPARVSTELGMPSSGLTRDKERFHAAR